MDLIRDLHLALRRLAREKGFSTVVVLTLALAIGVNTVVFSFINFFVLRPLPVKDPDGLVMVWSTHAERSHRTPAAYRDFLAWRGSARTFADFAALDERTYNLSGLGAPLRVQGRTVSASLFDLWGLPAVRGRTLVADDDHPGAARVVLLSHGFWKRQLGADEGVVGR